MNFVYYYDDNHQEPKPGDLLFLWTEKNQRNALHNFVGIVVFTSTSQRIENKELRYKIAINVLKHDGTIVFYVLIWDYVV